MGFFARLLGISKTKPPQVDCWTFRDDKIEIDLARAGELSTKNGAIRLEGKGLPQRVLVFQGQDGNFHALHNKCTHGGRRLDPLPGQPQIECCSVGKSKFDYSGEKLAGPAKGSVNAFSVHRENDKLIISLK